MRALGLTVAALALCPALVSLGGCVRDVVGVCPDISEGDLVITEFRGPQTGDDTAVVWVELYNATSSVLDLEGLRIRYRTIDGGTDIPVLVRRPVGVPANAYAVLGLIPDDSLPPYVDYGFSGDFHQGYLAAAAVDLYACTTLIDRAVYRSLPKTGTYSLGGTPSASNNDVEANWCTNPAPDGTPKMANPACP